jgi:hypothetical protein
MIALNSGMAITPIAPKIDVTPVIGFSRRFCAIRNSTLALGITLTPIKLPL